MKPLKGDKFYVRACGREFLEKGESGGAVSALLKFALESGSVDAVLGVRKGADLYDAVPVLITDPAEISDISGSLHCGTLLLSRLFSSYLGGAKDLKVAAALKGCDVMGLYELAKRGEVRLENILMLGLNCGGSVSPEMARKMAAEKFALDPDSVEKERISKGKFIFRTPEGEFSVPMDELEEEGYGRRSNCRRCKLKIPRQADLACGEWGVIGTEATFVEVCSAKGAELLEKAEASGAIKASSPVPKGLEVRGKIERSMLNLAEEWREKDFRALGEGKARLKQLINETSRCIKCYTCIEVCPALPHAKPSDFTVDASGKVPPAFAFHTLRYSLVADSCINCGQCEELCPMDIPNALFMHSFAVELQELYGYRAGEDLSLPTVAPLEAFFHEKGQNKSGKR
ncbi:formate dehydrogenase [Methanosarcina sp. 2.H.T.1A.6]|uniref:Coenzyme F420 hydrogenase/dehydrogenase, beta subunit C-terminal domain n=1 Tax=unclassified Methanosarcina TaxID=2644672 RepID=UPI000620F5F1|nr:MULTISPECIES: Coenzyme F420 hydrogenase/dehydrogenase, beta subunit C-terminal domain [unclassified Methanosarcina]KKG13275.1 formate dehydrogenase [Methanosarcina sp. 2.H.T.1A.15]KKG15662.1 formate dehydrogenase [Methanosarcina sp. 2.H.T.1A.3]KKG24645.1 formate dehydrogenase [Methanosarcina sp. 2.H.T.1A.6]KKG25757.1 formate dehydrogenase [Methanosarcina sp. 2.H.T.1A.8]